MRLDTRTRSGRMIREPSRMASCEPIWAPRKDAAEIAREIDKLGMSGRLHHSVAKERHEGEHIEGACSRPEDAVIKADGNRRGEAEGQGRHPGLRVLVLHLA